MGIEGRLIIDLRRSNDGTGRVAIASSRPLSLTRAFVGKRPEETVRTVPLLFNVCAMAQGTASVQACERALGIEADAATGVVRQLLVLTETLREHLIRAVLNWPPFLGLEANRGDMLRVMRLYEALRRTLDPEYRVLTIGGRAGLTPAQIAPVLEQLERLVEALVVGEALETWSDRRSCDDFIAWSQGATTPAQKLVMAVLDRGWAGAGRATTQFLPRLDDSDLGARLFDGEAAAFVAAPTWEGRPHETSALARQADAPLVNNVARVYGANGLLARLAAHLVEMAQLPALMRTLVEQGAEPRAAPDLASQRRCGRGVVQVEAARGRLVHGVEIEDGLVRRYEVLAPTEWNFHVDGAAARGLADIAGRERDTREIADLYVTAVDPCVGYEVRLH